MVDQSAVRAKSLETIKASKFHIAPIISDFFYLSNGKSVDEVVTRLLALNVTVACAFGYPRDRAEKWVESESFESSLTDAEKKFIYESYGYPLAISDWVDCIHALAWMLNLVDDFSFTKLCPDTLVTLVPNLKYDEPSVEFRAKAKLRPIDEVAQMADTAHCYYWSYEDLKLKGLKMHRSITKKWRPNLVIEPLRVFNWFFSDIPWAEVGPPNQHTKKV